MFLSIHLSNILVTLILFGSFPIWAWIKWRMLRVLIKLTGTRIKQGDHKTIVFFFKHCFFNISIEGGVIALMHH